LRYRLAIFDFDGTLANSFPWFLSVANDVAGRYKFKRIEESEIETLRGYDARQMIRHLGIAWWKVPLIANHMRKETANAIGHISLFDGADHLLRRLSHTRIKLAVVTSNSYANVRHVLGPDTAALVDYYECGVSTFGKHSRFRKVLKQSGVRASEALSIGDEIRDFEAAKRAGIPFGAVSWGFTTVDALRALGPAEVFTSFADIAKRLA
jgi:phosphoglycolate phosphatase